MSYFLTIEPSLRHEGKQIQPASFELRWRCGWSADGPRQVGGARAGGGAAALTRHGQARGADVDKSAVNLGLARSLADQRSVQRRHKDHLFELHMAVEASEKEHQLRCARALLDERLAVECSSLR